MKLVNNIIVVLSLVVSILSKNYLLAVGLIPLLGLSFFIRKNNKNLEFIYLIFLFVSYVLGFVFDYYNKLYYFDAIAHSLFGIVASIYALPFLKKFKRYDSKNKLFNVIFIIVLTLSLAGLWEIIEFVIDKLIVSANMQRSLNNTMKDIISAFLFSILYSLIYLDKYKLIEELFITKD